MTTDRIRDLNDAFRRTFRGGKVMMTSGVDELPDCVKADALVQVAMVSKATGIAQSTLRQLISRENHSAQLGFLGSSYIDVLQLNEALVKLR